MVQLHKYNPHKSAEATLRTSLGLAQEMEILMQPQYITLSWRAKDIAGLRFGRLVALGPVGRVMDGSNSIIWHCQCDCGNTVYVPLGLLSRGHTRSCKCLMNEVTSRGRKTTHGMAGTRIHRIWRGIIARCNNPNVKDYPRYGGRGITICDEWRHSLEAFMDHVSQLPHYDEKDYSIDRIENDGNYEPGNVRWVTSSEQSRNRHNNKLVTFQGRTQCVTAWANEVGLDHTVLGNRLRYGWTVERALTEPIKVRTRHTGRKAGLLIADEK